MGKSSSCSKKINPSRDSFKLRSVKKKKTKRNKTKTRKIRRLKDYSDESESSGSDSSLYSSSEDDYRRQKRRSKVSKQRSRKRYSSSESDDDDQDYTRLLRKKKKSKRKNEHVGKKKKKIVSRKKPKSDSSSSSTSSELGSVRDYQSDDGSERDEKRTGDRRKLGKVKAMRKRSKDESEKDSEPDECWQVEDEVMTEKNSQRLKSIIVVSYNYDNDERKTDMVHDYDEKKYLDAERYGDATISYPRTGADENGRKTVGYNEFEDDTKSETSKSSRPDNSLKDDDLEAILKQKALENLIRFRGIASKEVPSALEGETLQIESENAQKSQDHGRIEQKLCVCAGSEDLVTSQKILQVVNVKESGTVLTDLASQQEQQPGDTAKVKTSSGISSCSTKRKLIRPVLGQESLNLASRKEAVGCQDAEAESITKVSSTLSAQPFSHADTETLDEIKGGAQSEQKTMDETKEESQYEQKTMTVMRGGEMVQVSYKVYIPKKTSSLGRRKLKR